MTKAGQSSPSRGRRRPSRSRSSSQSKGISPGKSGPPLWRMNSRLPPGAVNPTTVPATTNTGWPLLRAWSPRRAWLIQPRFSHERRRGPLPTETLLTASPSSCFESRAPEARWLLLGLACTFATYWMLQQASVEPIGEPAGMERPRRSVPSGIRCERRPGHTARHAARARAGSSRGGVNPHDGRA